MITTKTKQAYNLLHEGVLALAKAERQGIRVDVEYLENTMNHLERKIDRMEMKFRDSVFYRHWAHTTKNTPNIHSGPQLENFLYKVKKLKPLKLTESNRGAVDEESLTLLNIPELNDLIQIRKLKKIKDTYLASFLREQVNGYIHPFFNLHLVNTYRSSSDSPNFQNIPKRDEEAQKITRNALFARPGHQLLEVDYSGLEVRIAACVTRDSNLLKYIKNPESDMHGDMASQLFKIDDFDKKKKGHKHLRGAAKNGFIFPEFYGDYYKNCAENLACNWGKLNNGSWKKREGVEIEEGLFLSDHLKSKGIRSLSGFEKHIQKIEKDFWDHRFPDYRSWQQRAWRLYQKHGYIGTATGFCCSGVMSRNNVFNYPVQGPAFHCLLWSFIRLTNIMENRGWKTRLIGQIHDAIILDVHPDELDDVLQTTKQVMCVDLRKEWDWIITPLDIEADLSPIDGSWANMKTISF